MSIWTTKTKWRTENRVIKRFNERNLMVLLLSWYIFFNVVALKWVGYISIDMVIHWWTRKTLLICFLTVNLYMRGVHRNLHKHRSPIVLFLLCHHHSKTLSPYIIGKRRNIEWKFWRFSSIILYSYFWSWIIFWSEC